VIHATSTPPIALAPGAVFFSDNGRTICRCCAGQSALYTGRDISGQRVERATLDDAREWERALARPLACELGCTTLSTLSGADGWPAQKGSAL
jgi:hypothetical protein